MIGKIRNLIFNEFTMELKCPNCKKFVAARFNKGTRLEGAEFKCPNCGFKSKIAKVT